MPYKLDERKCRNLDISAHSEWLLTNGLGGYSMGTVSGINTRKYHGILVAAPRSPVDRMVLLANLEAFVQSEGNPIGLSANQYVGAIDPAGYQFLESFNCGETATWVYHAGGMALLKQLAMHPGVNACTLAYRNIGDKPLLLTLRPLVCHKFYHETFLQQEGYPEASTYPKNRTIVKHREVDLILAHDGGRRMPVQGWYYNFLHERDQDRKLDAKEDLFCPCEISYELMAGEQAVLVASANVEAEPYTFTEEAKAAPGNLTAMLKAAAGRYFAHTEQRHTIIAGYPWFGDWGRDTMVAIPGLCIPTGRIEEAKAILRDYSGQMDQGLIPNRFVEQGDRPEYNNADGTLWFANAIYKVLSAQWDEAFAAEMLGCLEEVFRWHIAGTHYGIGVDPEDGLLRQGAEGLQLTWMDAKVGEWVVTPRSGKAVEINGLWINALRAMEWLADRLRSSSAAYREAAEKAEAHFDQRFWSPVLGHYLDTVDPEDGSLRPNQVIAMALPFSPATGDHAREALVKVGRELLTSTGLRTLGPHEPGYKGRYAGALPELDAAYHQGTVWPWLLGSYITALVKLTGDRHEARRILRNVRDMLTDYGIGGIAEVYDGDEPQHPNGCPWQAWSVAENLRAAVEDVEGD